VTITVDTMQVNRWLPFGVPDSDVRLYCLPHAGGSASAYRPWFDSMDGIAVCPVQPPGRETRLRDTPYDRMGPLVAELADVVMAHQTGPYAVYGHSLGALVGFELLREIRRRGGDGPVHFFVSGCPAPDFYDRDDADRVAEMDDSQIVGLLRRLGGTPDWMLSDPSVLRMILPPFRADFSVKETYRYQWQQPLATPITAIAASRDPRAGVESMAGWLRQTNRSYQTHTVDGGHFAVLERPRRTHRIIADALIATAVPVRSYRRGPAAVKAAAAQPFGGAR
jgi:surfactin synthase thioesterase subunit